MPLARYQHAENYIRITQLENNNGLVFIGEETAAGNFQFVGIPVIFNGKAYTIPVYDRNIE